LLKEKQKREIKLLPVPTNEISHTLSIDTISFVSPKNFKNKVPKFCIEKQDHKDTSTSTGEQTSISMNNLNVDEFSESQKKEPYRPGIVYIH